MSEIMDATTIGAVFAATVTAHPGNTFLAVPASTTRGYLPAGLEITYARGRPARRRAVGRLRRCGLWPRPPRRDAAREPPRAHPAQARAQFARRLRRAHQSRLSCRRDGLSRRPQQARSRAGARLPRGAGAGSLGAEHAQAAAGAVRCLSVRSAESGGARGPVLRRARIRPPASSTRRAPPAGPRAASSRTATRSPSGAWYAALGGSADIRVGKERIYNPLPLYHVNSGVVSLMGAILTGNCPGPARPLPSPALVARDRRDAGDHRSLPRHHRAAAARPAAERAGPRATACASASAPASSRSCTRPSRRASASR